MLLSFDWDKYSFAICPEGVSSTPEVYLYPVVSIEPAYRDTLLFFGDLGPLGRNEVKIGKEGIVFIKSIIGQKEK